MEDDEARTSLLSSRQGTQSTQPHGAQSQQPFYNDHQPTFTTKLVQLAFVVVVVLMVVISFVLSIYRSAAAHNGIYILLGLAMVGFLAVEGIMILFIRNGDLPVEKTWFLYAVGSFIVIECIFTNILLFR